MNSATRKTRVCTIDALDEELRAAIRAYGTKLGLEDMESDVLMCCETISFSKRRGFLGGIQTTLSAVYVTPKWLVWADSSGQNDVAVGAAPLNQIDVHNDRSSAVYAITPDQGLNITERDTGRNRKETTFIVLEAQSAGKKFRQVLNSALRNVAE